MISIPDQIVKWLPELTEQELKTYLVINRYITEQQPLPIEKLFDNTGIENHGPINRAIASLIDKGLISFKVSFQGEEPRPVRWYDTTDLKSPQTRKINDFGRKLVKSLLDLEAESGFGESGTSHGYYIEDLLTGGQTPAFLAFYEQKNKKEKIKRKKRTKKKKNKKEKNKKIYVCILYLERYDNRYNQGYNPYGLYPANIEKCESPPSLSKTKFFIASFSSSKKLNLSKKELSDYYQGFQNFIELATLKARARQANQLTSYLAEKLYSVSDGGLNLTKVWKTKQKASAKRILREHPNIPFDEWLEAIDFFFEDEFWCGKITNFISLEKNIHRYQLAKNKKTSKSKKAKARLSNQQIIR